MGKGEGRGDRDGTAAFAEAFISAYGERFPEYHLAWSVFFVTHMSGMRRHLGDLDDALLLAAIGLGPVGHLAREGPRAHRDSDARAARHGAHGTPTNATSLADVTGIPRETVRRRLAAFQRRGWVEQGEDRNWRLCLDEGGRARVAADLTAAHADFLQCLARLVAEFDRLGCRAE